MEFHGYLTDVVGDRALEYVEENRNQSFFMYLAFNAVHTSMKAKEDHLEKYSRHPRAELAAMTWSWDENVGKLMGELDNTLIFFFSDNRGKTFDGLTSSLDIFKTSITAAGIKEDKSWSLDVVNLLPYLKGEKDSGPHHKLFWRKLGKSAARFGNAKSIKVDDFGSVHYNLERDLGESEDLSKQDFLTLESLLMELEIWEKAMMASLWIEGVFWEERNYRIHKDLMLNKFRAAEEMKIYFKKTFTDSF